MTKRKMALFLLIALAPFAEASALGIPAYKGRVNDYAGLLRGEKKLPRSSRRSPSGSSKPPTRWEFS